MDAERELALRALQQYDLVPRRVTLAARSFNTVFRVSTDSGAYSLRVAAPLQMHGERTLRAEGDWLRRLRASGVTVPALHRNRAGADGTEVAMADGTLRTCALFDWIPGRLLRTRLSARSAAALGALSARLHDGAAEARPPEGVLVADRVLYWRLPDRVSALPGGEVFAEALQVSQHALDRSWAAAPHAPHLLHGDLTPANTIVSRGGGLVPIDFQDLVVGLDVQDLSFTLAALRRIPEADRLEEAFRAGYRTQRPWPDLPEPLLDALLVARALNQINLTVALHGVEALGDYLAQHAERLRAWLRRPDTHRA
ncbi:phosphotransferase [Amnibacterium sp. CER49]|uniref:phosphotransferase enzyme family protein n=1 Tax=Amnibacterium sp. CER49 TaxID=3039161 RepID=UPI002448C590|nr:phosphotransferase [Amnibacterium sp. CER49]MDH2442969.1 phosphotransferase [Amnibacterium sp. CER49]